MKGISTLIKMYTRELDALRRELVKLETQKEQLLQLIIDLQNELTTEQEAAAGNIEMAGFLVGFTKRIKDRQKMITQEVISLDTQIIKLRDKIAEAFGEVKKYEIVQEREKQRMKAKIAAQEQSMLDEVAIQQFSRKEE